MQTYRTGNPGDGPRRFRRLPLAKSAATGVVPSGMLARPEFVRRPRAARPLPRAAFPAWARAVQAPETAAEAGFLAGAALARLDAVVRENPPWSGAWRQRLALQAAAASVRRAGRNEDEAALRDALHLTRSGADPGPAGAAVAGLARADDRIGRAMAIRDRGRRRGLGPPRRRSVASGDCRRRGLRRRSSPGAVRGRARP